MDAEAGVYARHAPYLDCYVQVGVAQGKVISVDFVDDPGEDAGDDLPLLSRIGDYLDGVRENFVDVDVALTVPTDQRQVLEAVRQVPYGDQVTAAELARMTPGLSAEDDDDVVAVREALAANPVPLVIPDHRVRDGASAAPPDVEQRLRSVEGL